MKFGASMFFTDYSMTPEELAVALEAARLRHRLGAGASHIPVSRKTPFVLGGDLPKRYYDVMDPFVTLSHGGRGDQNAEDRHWRCLIAQRDPIQTAKLVASIDQVSGGRFVFGVGNGWNQDEMENHGTVFASRHKLARERIEAMKAIWTQDTAGITASSSISGRCGPGQSRCRNRIRRSWWAVLSHTARARGAVRRRLDATGDLGIADAAHRTDPTVSPDGGGGRARSCGGFDISIGGQAEDVDLIKRYRDLGVNRVSTSLLSEKAETILPVLDRWAAIIRAVNSDDHCQLAAMAVSLPGGLTSASAQQHSRSPFRCGVAATIRQELHSLLADHGGRRQAAAQTMSAHHHRMVLMHHVVAVHRVTARHVAEAHEERTSRWSAG